MTFLGQNLAENRKEHIPATIAQRMIDYGYKDYQMHIGEHLGDSAKDITFPRPSKP